MVYSESPHNLRDFKDFVEFSTEPQTEYFAVGFSSVIAKFCVNIQPFSLSVMKLIVLKWIADPVLDLYYQNVRNRLLT